MKKNLLVFILFLSFAKQSSSQCLAKGITTNPSAPVNNELPSNKNLYFDWTQQFYNNNSTCQPNAQVESPFYKIDNLEALRTSKDMLPVDGWELIRREFGYTDANILKPDVPQHTYFILYNKFTGVLRILLKVCRGIDYNGAKITLKFDASSSWQTALLSLTDGIAKPLATTHVANPAAQSVSVYINDDTKWFYADFPMAYDACTCQYASKLNIVSNLIASSTIDLQGSITGKITSITNGVGTVANDGKYSFKDFASSTEKFSKTYDNVDKMITESKNITNALFGSSSSQSTALTTFQTALKANDFLKAGLAAVPWLKAAVSLFDIFIGGGKASPQPVQIMPLAVNLAVKLSGSISTSNQYHAISFTTPGSLNAQNDPAVYPFYNEVLGVFNLLNVPTFIDNWSFTQSGPFPSAYKHTYYLKEPIRYVVNPASGLVLQDAQIAYEAIPQVATITGEPVTLPLNFASNGFTFPESKDAVTGHYTYRTEYINTSCLGNDHRFYFAFPANPTGGVPKMYIKLLLNFKKVNDPNGQNVLQVLTFPILIEGHLSGTPAGLVAFNPAACVGGMFVQANTADINTFCSSTTYKANRGSRVATKDSIVNNNSESITIFPNPVNDKINVTMNSHETIKNVLLVNLSGQTLLSKKYSFQSGHIEINTKNYPEGVYILKIVTNKKSISKKIIISKN